MNIGDTVQVLGEQTRGIVRKVKNDRWSPSKGSLVTFDRTHLSSGVPAIQDAAYSEGNTVTLRSNILRIVVAEILAPRDLVERLIPAAPVADFVVADREFKSKPVVVQGVANVPKPIKDMSFLNLTLNEAYASCELVSGIPQSELRAKYAKLNLGMQKMNLVNRLRSAAKKATAK